MLNLVDFTADVSSIWHQLSALLLSTFSAFHAAFSLCDPHLPFSYITAPTFGPAALPFLPCHICHGRSVASVALGFKFNLVSICCNCFERRPCLHVFPLLCLLEYSVGCVCVGTCVCKILNNWPATHCQWYTLSNPVFCHRAPWRFDNGFVIFFSFEAAETEGGSKVNLWYVTILLLEHIVTF